MPINILKRKVFILITTRTYLIRLFINQFSFPPLRMPFYLRHPNSQWYLTLLRRAPCVIGYILRRCAGSCDHRRTLIFARGVWSSLRFLLTWLPHNQGYRGNSAGSVCVASAPAARCAIAYASALGALMIRGPLLEWPEWVAITGANNQCIFARCDLARTHRRSTQGSQYTNSHG